MKHFWRTVSVCVAVCVASVPLILADPSFAHYVAVHPWAATYVPLAAGILRTIYKAAKDTQASAGDTGSVGRN